MQVIALFSLLSVLATIEAAPHLHIPRSTAVAALKARSLGSLVDGLGLSPAVGDVAQALDAPSGPDGGMAPNEPRPDDGMGRQGEGGNNETTVAPSSSGSGSSSFAPPAVLAAPSPTSTAPASSSDWSASATMPSTTTMITTSTETPTATPGPATIELTSETAPSATALSASTSTSMASTSFTPSMTSSFNDVSSSETMAEPTVLASPSASASASESGYESVSEYASESMSLSENMSETTTASETSTSTKTPASTAVAAADDSDKEKPKEKEKGKRIRYKQCPSTGTVSEIKITPCEGGKGTILDPCHFHAGSNYTIEMSWVSSLDSDHPRSNLIARDRSMSNGPGSETFPYSGQSFDACAYTDCPTAANKTNQYLYEFVTLNDRFDQLTFNVTEGFEGPSMFCAYFPVTFVPNVVSRSLRLPFAGLGGRGPW